mgnify:CR=1 FL=1
MNKTYDYLIKTLLIGSSNVGKTSIMKQFADHDFKLDTVNTVGVDLKIKTINYQNKEFRIQLWDTAGHERFKTITSSYYRGSDCVLIVFALNHIDSFKDLYFWFNEIDKYSTNILLYLIGNKSDLNEKKITTKEIKEIINKYKITDYIETSAKENKNIDELFINIADKYYTKQKEKKYNINENVIIPGAIIQSKIVKKCC